LFKSFGETVAKIRPTAGIFRKRKIFSLIQYVRVIFEVNELQILFTNFAKRQSPFLNSQIQGGFNIGGTHALYILPVQLSFRRQRVVTPHASIRDLQGCIQII
jgi:hypothetical protein